MKQTSERSVPRSLIGQWLVHRSTIQDKQRYSKYGRRGGVKKQSVVNSQRKYTKECCKAHTEGKRRSDFNTHRERTRLNTDKHIKTKHSKNYNPIPQALRILTFPSLAPVPNKVLGEARVFNFSLLCAEQEINIKSSSFPSCAITWPDPIIL